MSTSTQSRQPKGQPTGGEFASKPQSDDEVGALSGYHQISADVDAGREVASCRACGNPVTQAWASSLEFVADGRCSVCRYAPKN